MTITKDYENSCLNNCVLHLFQYKIVASQDYTILFLPFPARFSFIITTFATPEPPQNGTKKKRGTREYAQQLNIRDLNFLKMFG